MKRIPIALALVFLALSSAAALADTCEEYAGLTTLPHHQLGLYEDFQAVDIQTRGNYAYMFDGGHLDCLNLEDPWQIQVISYSPPINITPNPTRLLKVGRDHLYAWHTGGVSVIDISRSTPPVLVANLPTFATGTYVGESGGHGFFVMPNGQVQVYDFRAPLTPQLAGTFNVPVASGYLLSGATGLEHLYMLWLGPQWNEFLIYDVSSPAVPVLRAHYVSGGSYPPDFEAVLENIGGDPMFVSGRRLWINYATLQLAPESSNSVCFDLTDPANPVAEWGSDDIVLAEADGVTYGYDAGPYGAYPWDMWLTIGGTDIHHWYGAPVPFLGLPANFALTDRGMVFTADIGQPNDVIVSAPRQCDQPAIVAGSVGHQLLFVEPDRIELKISWRTDGWTDPLLDRVVLSDAPGNPPDGQIGVVTLSGGEDPVLQADGTWRHTVSWGKLCVGRSKYFYDVRSVRTGLIAEVLGKSVKILSCPSTLKAADPGDGMYLQVTSGAGSTAEFAFALPDGVRDATLAVYSIDGRRVCELFRGDARPGTLTAVWGGRDDSGRSVPSGVYHARLAAGGQVRNARLVLLK